jgi:hypothetical protein
MALRNVYASAEDLAAELARRVGNSSQAAIARQARVKPPLISNVIAGKVNPCGRLLKWLGYERVVTYRRISE